MEVLLVVLVFGFGLCVGSFLNVLIWRTLNGLSPYKGRSFCDHCKRQLAWYENIPLISYLFLRGRCRTCRKKIDPSYPLVELVTGILFVWWATLGFAFFKLTQAPLVYFQPFFWLLVGLLLIVIFFADILHGIIPDFAVIFLGLITFAYRLVLIASGNMQLVDFLKAILVGLGVLGFYLLLHYGTRGKGMGFGDVKLSLVLGVLLGYPKSIVATFLSFLLGGVVAGMMLMAGKKRLGQTIPFGPFMVIGAAAALVWGDYLWRMYVAFL